MSIQESLMKVVVKVANVVALAKRFEASPGLAMRELVAEVQTGVRHALERVMEAEIGLYLGQDSQKGNKRNGYVTRSFGIKGVGTVRVRVPRDRAGTFQTAVVPARRRYDEAVEKDLALLHLAGISTRMLGQISHRVLGVRVSAQEVSQALHTVVPAAKAFLERPLDPRRWKYLYLDGTFFPVRRTTVMREPTLVVVGVDDEGRKSVLSMVQGDKDAKGAWQMVLAELKARGLDPKGVELAVMDGLPGLSAAFLEAFPHARVGRCWVHKAKNVFPRVPTRYQAEFKRDWDAMQYAPSGQAAREAWTTLQARWGKLCAEAVGCLERDLEAMLVHYEFPKEHWDALRTTNPIERVNKEFKRRSRAMETLSPEGLSVLLAFTALRLEVGWATTPIHSGKLASLKYRTLREERQLEVISNLILN